jgi:PBP1b-binding outer membrane lipoprotein LpoB
MIKKIAVIAISAILLGGCTLGDMLKTNEAASDMKPGAPIATSTPAPTTSPDVSLEAIPSTSTSTDITSLEKDINNTKILDEDFSDLN